MSPLLTGFPFSNGGGGTPKATVTATTGSPTIDTTSRAGKTIYKFTGSGTITVGVGGTCEYLVIGGGCNGGGGYIYNTSAVLQAGTLTVTIGAGVYGGGTGTTGGNPSQLGDIVALSGGTADWSSSSGTYKSPGGTGGGSRQAGVTNPPRLSGVQGYAGGAGFEGMQSPAFGGGGGAGGVGGNAPNVTTGGTGGAGAANSITGSSVTYSAGGGGYGSTTTGSPTGAGAANTGNGGGGSNAGGSGFVVVVIG